MQNQSLLFRQVKKVVNKRDPIGLISGGAPEDEYDSEIAKVVNLLNAGKISAEAIRNIFVSSFDEQLAGEIEKYNSIADDIRKMR